MKNIADYFDYVRKFLSVCDMMRSRPVSKAVTATVCVTGLSQMTRVISLKSDGKH